MKYAFIFAVSIFSLSSFAQMVDFKDSTDLPNSIIIASEKTFIDVPNLFSYSGQTYGSRNRLYCTNHKTITQETRDLLAKTPVEDLKVDISGGYYHFFLDNEYLMLCNYIDIQNLGSELSKIFPTRKESSTQLNGVDGKIKVLGVTDEEKPEAIVEINGAEEIVPCDDLLFDHAQYGTVQTGLKALSKDLKSVMKVLKVGPKLAKVEKNNNTEIVQVKDLFGIQKSRGFTAETPVYITDGYAGRILGQTVHEGYHRYVVQTKDGYKIIDDHKKIQKLTSNKDFRSQDNVFVKIGDKRLRAIVLGVSSTEADAKVITERDGKVEAFPASQVIKIIKN